MVSYYDVEVHMITSITLQDIRLHKFTWSLKYHTGPDQRYCCHQIHLPLILHMLNSSLLFLLHSTWHSTQTTEDSPLVEGVDSLKHSV
jgi:hypothetical protein